MNILDDHCNKASSITNDDTTSNNGNGRYKNNSFEGGDNTTESKAVVTALEVTSTMVISTMSIVFSNKISTDQLLYSATDGFYNHTKNFVHSTTLSEYTRKLKRGSRPHRIRLNILHRTHRS